MPLLTGAVYVSAPCYQLWHPAADCACVAKSLVVPSPSIFFLRLTRCDATHLAPRGKPAPPEARGNLNDSSKLDQCMQVAWEEGCASQARALAAGAARFRPRPRRAPRSAPRGRQCMLAAAVRGGWQEWPLGGTAGAPLAGGVALF